MDEPGSGRLPKEVNWRDGAVDPLPGVLRRLSVVVLASGITAFAVAIAFGRDRFVPAGILCIALTGAFLFAVRVQRTRGPRAGVTVVVASVLAAGVPLTLISAHIPTAPVTLALFAVLIALPYYGPREFGRLSVAALVWTVVVVGLREFVFEAPHDLPVDYVRAINVVSVVTSAGAILYLFAKLRGKLGDLAANARGVETRYRALVEQLPAVTFIDEVTGPGADDVRPLYMSPQAVETFGYPIEAWREPTFWRSVIHPEDREWVTRAGETAGARDDAFSAEYRIIHADGHAVWVQEESVPIHDEQGRPRWWQGVIFDITVRRNAEEQRHRGFELLQRTDAERRRLLAQLVTAQEQERRRIAAEIHDDPVQKMTAVGIRLDMLRATLSEPEHMRLLEQVHEAVQLAVKRMRELMFDLRPPELDRAGLAAAVREFAAQLNDPGANGMRINVDDRLAIEPSDEIRAVAYRIVAEALTNAKRHSRASEVDVLLNEVDGGLLLRVRDDGIGIEQDVLQNGRPGHLGLVSVRERAEMLGGWSRIVSATEGGTTVEAWLPIGRSLRHPGAAKEAGVTMNGSVVEATPSTAG